MKNTLKYSLLLLLTISFIAISCEKETTDDDPNGGDVTATCHIKKTISSDDEVTFIYNIENQLTKITFGSEQIFEFTYNADGTISNSMVLSNDGEIITTTTYEYNAVGLPVNSVVIDGESSITYTYEYTDDKLTRRVGVGTDDLATINIEDTITYSGDNITEIQNIVVVESFEVSTTTRYFTFEYDNKKNPFSKLNIQYTNIGAGGNFALFASKNNYTSMVATDADGTVIPDESETKTFEYNTNNYPSKTTFSEGNYTTLTYYPCE